MKAIRVILVITLVLIQFSLTFGQSTGKSQFLSSFSGLVVLEDESDSNSARTKVLLGDIDFFSSSMLIWIDSIVIQGELSGYDLPHYNETHGYNYDGIVLFTTDSIYFIKVRKDGAFSHLNVSYQRQALSGVAQAVYSDEYIFTLQYNSLGSKLSRLDEYSLHPELDIQLADSVSLLKSIEFELETIHHRNSNFLWINWYNLAPLDTITIPDSLGEFKQVDYFINFQKRALVVNNEDYHLFAPNRQNSKYDTIYSYNLPSETELSGSAEDYYYTDTIINDTTIVKTISIYGFSWSDTTKIPGHAVHIQTVSYPSITYLYYDTLSRNIYLANDVDADSLTHRYKIPIAIAPIHLSSVGIEQNRSNIQQSSYYPNPVTETLYYNALSSYSSSSSYRIEIFNTTGKLIRAFMADNWKNDLEISLTGLPKGLLLIRLTRDNSTETFKVIHQ